MSFISLIQILTVTTTYNNIDLRDLMSQIHVTVPISTTTENDIWALNYIKVICDYIIMVALSVCILVVVRAFDVERSGVVAQQGNHFAETQLSSVSGVIQQLVTNQEMENRINPKVLLSTEDSGLGLISSSLLSNRFINISSDQKTEVVPRQMILPIQCTEAHPSDSYSACYRNSNLLVSNKETALMNI
ncbi:hypothetical protein SNE40_019237 [Patella caerulea]|uniref:Uncharacterized protein n=1 Tax=Patella caerulea TaxID=87958 RepID=A0AAN8J880_PATCE